MRRIRALIVLSALVAGVLASFIAGATPAKAAVNGFGTCHVYLFSDGTPSSHKPIECYW